MRADMHASVGRYMQCIYVNGQFSKSGPHVGPQHSKNGTPIKRTLKGTLMLRTSHICLHRCPETGDPVILRAQSIRNFCVLSVQGFNKGLRVLGFKGLRFRV